ncbi:Kelch domain-containing protein 4 [Glycine soja]
MFYPNCTNNCAGDVMMSLFLNELYGFQLDTNRWYPLELRKEKSTKDKLKKIEQNCPDDVNKINPTCTTREETEESEDEENNIDDISKNIASNMSIDDGETLTKSEGKAEESSAKLDIQSSLPEVVKPCGRINACMAVGRDTLYIYGGMMEIKDQEITLDDLYSLNLSKLDEWKCIIPASESEWVEASDDDEENEDDDEDESDGDSLTDEDEDDEEEEEEEAQNASVQVGDAVALIKGVGKNLRRKERRVRIEQIRASLGLSDSQRTPSPGESLKDFYRRTNMYWQMAAHEHTQHTGKELRKDGFDLAEARYRELKPILDELALLEAEQKAEEAEGPETSAKKRGKKKTRN